jgi:hypothetical protein
MPFLQRRMGREVMTTIDHPTLAEIETTIRPWSIEELKAVAFNYGYTESAVDQWLSEQPSEHNCKVRIESN